MIRIRIDRIDYMPDGPREEGLMWFENGEPVGRVIIEQTEATEPIGDGLTPNWEPVEAVES